MFAGMRASPSAPRDSRKSLFLTLTANPYMSVHINLAPIPSTKLETADTAKGRPVHHRAGPRPDWPPIPRLNFSTRYTDCSVLRLAQLMLGASPGASYFNS
jgi:hypothetical protein